MIKMIKTKEKNKSWMSKANETVKDKNWEKRPTRK